MSRLTDEQIEVLLRPIKPSRVHKLDGMSHVEAFDIRATLTRMFGFGRWDEVALEPTVLLYEQETTTKAGKPAFKVAYRASRRLVVRDGDGELLCSHDGSAVGESVMPDFKRGDAHDMAIKTAESQALKRAAINLGDQFGLSLYAKGSTGAVVKAVVGFEPAASGFVEPEPVEMGPDDPEPDEFKPAEPKVLSEANLAKFNEACNEAGLAPAAVMGSAFPSGAPEPLLDTHLPVMRDSFKRMKAALAPEVVDDAPEAGVKLASDAQVDERPAPRGMVGLIKKAYSDAGVVDRLEQLRLTAERLGLPEVPATHSTLSRAQAGRLLDIMEMEAGK
jgi:hypothetical protein